MKNMTNEKKYNPYNEINFNENHNVQKSQPIGRNVLFDAFQISVMFFPVHILLNALSYKIDVFQIQLFALLVCSVLTFFIVLSDSVKHAGFKWLISLPMSLIWIIYIRFSQFNIRILNWLIPDFGEPNFGDFGLASLMLMIYAAMTLFALGIGLVISGFLAVSSSETFYKIISFMKKVCSVTSIVLALAVLLLDVSMPPYVKVYG